MRKCSPPIVANGRERGERLRQYFPIVKRYRYHLRLEARGYATLLNNNGGLFCGGDKGRVVTVNGPALYQSEALVGLSLRF